MSMFESKVYECETCSQFFFFKLDMEQHKSEAGHQHYKVKDWKSPQPSLRINRLGRAPI